MARERVGKEGVLLAALAIEGGMGLAAWVVGVWIGVDPLATWRGDWRSAAFGIAATLPMLGIAIAVGRLDWTPLRRLRLKVLRLVRLLFDGFGRVELASVAVAAGLGEELVFRGLIQGGLASRIGPVPGLLAASVVFGLAHAVTPAYAVLAGLLGLYLGGIWMLSGDLAVPAAAHALYDFLILERLVALSRSRWQGRAGR